MKAKLALLACTVAACGDDSGLPDARGIDAMPNTGTVSLTWSIADGATALTCAQIGVNSVSIVSRDVDEPFGQPEVRGCSAMAGSVALLPGTYEITTSLGGVDAEPVVFDNIVVTTGQDTALGNAAFQVSAVGGFAFDMVAAGGNCTGAGITAVSLALATTTGTCVPATFDIEAGATQPAGTYTTDCTTPAPYAACIDSDQTVTAQPTITSGSYRLTITGDVSGTPCWSRTPQFDVPAGAAIRTLPVQNLVHDDVTPACNP
jgi:hypothetical protein